MSSTSSNDVDGGGDAFTDYDLVKRASAALLANAASTGVGYNPKPENQYNVVAKADEWHKMGKQSLFTNNFDDAIYQFTKAIFLQPTNAEYYASRGDCYLRLTDFHSALLNYRKAYRLDVTNKAIKRRTAHIHYYLGKLYLGDGATEDAKLSFSEAVALCPNEPEFWFNRIKAFMCAKEYEKALTELNDILDSAITNPFLLPGPPGPNSKPIKVLKRAKDTAKKTVFDNEINLAHTSDDASAADDVFIRKYVQGDDAQDLEDDKLVKLPEEMALNALLLRAKINLYLHNLDLVQLDVQWISTLDPLSPDVGYLNEELNEKCANVLAKSQASFMVEDYDLALKMANYAMELSPTNIKVYSMRAKIYRKIAKFEAALTDLKKALSLCLDAQNAHSQLAQQQRSIISSSEGLASKGILAALSENYDVHEENPYGESPPGTAAKQENMNRMSQKAAVQWDRWSIEDNKEMRVIQAQLAGTFNDLAAQYLNQNKLPNAMTCLNKAVELDTQSCSIFLNRGDCHRRMDNLEHAMADYHLAAKLEPKSPQVRIRFSIIHNEIGRQLYNRTQYEDAESEFTKAIKFNATVDQYFSNRGQARYRQNKWVPAYADFVDAVKINPHDAQSRRQALLLRSSIFKPQDLAHIPQMPPPPAELHGLTLKQRAMKK